MSTGEGSIQEQLALAASHPVVGGRRYSPRRLLERADAAVANPFFAYGAIVALQIRVLWRFWDYKDLTPGDTTSYFIGAISWAHGLHDNIVWSPLYTNFLGTILAVVGDVPTAMMIHRVLIIVAGTVLVLALMRSLLGPPLALLIASWWAVLPVNHRVEYEVHLFGLIPVLVALLVLARGDGRLRRGIALAVLVGTTVLMRNELAIATVVVALAIVAGEVRERRRSKPRASAYVRSYGLPLVIVLALAFGAYERSIIQGNVAREVFRGKQTVNVCQVYAFSYQQEHPTRFLGNPFVDCAPLMQRTFGRPDVTLAEAFAANPGAVAHFAAWNAGLIPAGMEVSLFGATSGGKDPGFWPVKEHRVYALVLSGLVLAAMGLGAGLLIKQRRSWQREWLTTRVWPVAGLAGVGLATLYVALAERPRPEYLYGGIICFFVVFGLCVTALLKRIGLTRFVGSFSVLALAVLLVPSHYHRGPRPLYNAVERLQVVRGELQRPGSVLLTSSYNHDICGYLAKSYYQYCAAPAWAALREQIVAGKSVGDVLRDNKVTVVYADPGLQADPAIRPFLSAPRSTGWRYVSKGVGSDGRWGVLLPSADHSA